MAVDPAQHRTEVSEIDGAYVVECSVCGNVGQPEMFEADAAAIAARHYEIGGFG